MRNAELHWSLVIVHLSFLTCHLRAARQRMSVFLGIDVGTSGTKTLAMDERGKILAEASEEYPCYYPRPLWSEQDPEDWWWATVATIRAIVKKAKLKAADVKGIGLSGQMH